MSNPITKFARDLAEHLTKWANANEVATPPKQESFFEEPEAQRLDPNIVHKIEICLMVNKDHKDPRVPLFLSGLKAFYETHGYLTEKQMASLEGSFFQARAQLNYNEAIKSWPTSDGTKPTESNTPTNQ